MKVAAVQMLSTTTIHQNLDTARRFLETAAQQGVELVVLPENFCAMPHHENDKLIYAENNTDILHSPIQHAIAKMAKDMNLWIIAGTIPLRNKDSNKQTYNSCLVYNPQGEQVIRYDKIHLFHFNSTKHQYSESSSTLAGTTPQAFYLTRETSQVKIGLSICYDLRFPELYRTWSIPPQKPCDILAVPAAFTYETGQAHWEILLRARAIENQCYVIAAAQGGKHENGRQTWGHSMIIDPWGTILCEQKDSAGVIVTDIDFSLIQSIREKLPALKNRMCID